MPQERESERQVYIAVRVDLDRDGNAVGAEVDCEGAPWPYCGDWTDANGQVFECESEDWRDGDEDEFGTAEAFVSGALAGASGRPAPVGLLAAVREVTVLGYTADGGVIVGPQGWEALLKAAARAEGRVPCEACAGRGELDSEDAACPRCKGRGLEGAS